MLKALEPLGLQRYAIGIGPNAPEETLALIGKHGTLRAALPTPETESPPGAGSREVQGTGEGKGAGATAAPSDQQAAGTAGEGKAAGGQGKQQAAGDRPPTVAAVFERLAAEIESSAKKLFLLSYCSALRAGKHTVRLEIKVGEATGELSYEFSADGFEPGCDASRVPSF